MARFSPSSLGLDHPIDLAVGPDGNLYVTDTSPSVTVISPQGKVLRRWGRRGSAPGDLSFPLDISGNIQGSIAVGPEDKVYVSDSGNHRVDVFSRTGTFIRKFGSYGFNDGQFLLPFNLAADDEGNVYVADDQEQTLSKFSPTGDFEWSIGGPTANDPDLRGHFHSPNVDAHGRVVAGIEETDRIVYIDAAGHKVDAFSTAADLSPCSASVDPAGDTLVDGCGDARDIQVFDRTHKLIGEWRGGPCTVAPLPGLHGQYFSLGDDGSILELKAALPGA